MKARIAQHEESLKSDSASCPAVGIRILLLIAPVIKWPLAKIDFTIAYLQTGQALGDVYVKSPK